MHCLAVGVSILPSDTRADAAHMSNTHHVRQRYCDSYRNFMIKPLCALMTPARRISSPFS